MNVDANYTPYTRQIYADDLIVLIKDNDVALFISVFNTAGLNGKDKLLWREILYKNKVVDVQPMQIR